MLSGLSPQSALVSKLAQEEQEQGITPIAGERVMSVKDPDEQEHVLRQIGWG